MTVNVVCKLGWVLERLARELETRLPHVRINAGQRDRTVDPRAPWHYYLPAKDLRKYPLPAGRAIGFYTHGDNGFDLIDRFAACVAMNARMGARLRELGAPHVTVIRPGTEPPPRPIVFGVIGRCYGDGRKGEQLVAQAVAAGYTFVACRVPPGPTPRALARHQWPCPGLYTIPQRDAFYAAIDYLVVTSTDEGGPMVVLEAIARGVPVIAPDVGFCWEFPVLRFERGNWASLESVLSALTRPPTWEAWAAGHRALFAALTATDGKVA